MSLVAEADHKGFVARVKTLAFPLRELGSHSVLSRRMT